MGEPTTTEPSPMLARARHVWVRLFARTNQQTQQLGYGVTEAMLVEEVQEELITVRDVERIDADQRVAAERSQRVTEVALLTAERDALSAETANLQVQVMQRNRELASRAAEADARQLEIVALRAALADARARAAKIRPPAGNWADWNAYLDRMPPLASHEIEAWRGAAIRRLAGVGVTQEDVTIARLAHMLLHPYQEPQTPDVEA